MFKKKGAYLRLSFLSRFKGFEKRIKNLGNQEEAVCLTVS